MQHCEEPLHVQRLGERLNTVYILKDQLKKIWSYKSPGWARRDLNQWYALAEASGVTQFKHSPATGDATNQGSSRTASSRSTPGQLEGMHNKVKVIKRQAYGFRDDDYFILKVKAAFHPNLR